MYRESYRESHQEPQTMDAPTAEAEQAVTARGREAGGAWKHLIESGLLDAFSGRAARTARPDTEAARRTRAERVAEAGRRAQAERVAEAAGPAAAEDERIFLLQRMLPPAVWREAGLEETRPAREYPILWPGSSRPRPIRPEFHGVGVVQAATHAHDGIHTRGLGLMFPPHTLHARNSTSVVVGDNCELQQVDHVHIRQAVVAQDDALKSARVKKIVARARPGRDNTDVVRGLRIALNELVERPEEAGPTSMTRKLRADCVPSIHQAESVQLGDDTLTCLDTRYVVERTVIPAGALLADSEELARRYVNLVAAPQDDPGALADFLADLVGAAENATDENVLGYADGLPRQRATVLGLFGLLTVEHASSVMIGTGNELHTELDLETARFRPEQAIGRGVAQHRKNRPAQADPPPGAHRRPSPRPSATGTHQDPVTRDAWPISTWTPDALDGRTATPRVPDALDARTATPRVPDALDARIATPRVPDESVSAWAPDAFDGRAATPPVPGGSASPWAPDRSAGPWASGVPRPRRGSPWTSGDPHAGAAPPPAGPSGEDPDAGGATPPGRPAGDDPDAGGAGWSWFR